MRSSGERRTDIVFLNILLCFFVIFIHTASEIVTEMPHDETFFRMIYSAQRLASFVVPAFIMLSGVKLFLHNVEDINYPQYYLKRFLRIVVPYVVWCVIYYIYFCFAGYYTFDIKQLCVDIVCGSLWAHFYFVIILIQFDILTPLWIFLYKKGSSSVHLVYAFIITAISVQFLPSILSTVFPSMPSVNVQSCFLRYLFYWTAGCMIGKNYSAFRGYLLSNKLRITVIFILCAVCEVYFSLSLLGSEPVWLELIYMLYTTSAILFFYMLSQAFANKGGKLLKPLSFIDKSSYLIYLMHCLIIVVTNDLMTKYNILNLKDRFGIRTAVVYTVSILVCLIWNLMKLPFRKKRGDA